MSSLSNNHPRALVRAGRGAWRFVLKTMRVLFILMLVILPVPIAQLFAQAILHRMKAVPMETTKKD